MGLGKRYFKLFGMYVRKRMNTSIHNCAYAWYVCICVSLFSPFCISFQALSAIVISVVEKRSQQQVDEGRSLVICPASLTLHW